MRRLELQDIADLMPGHSPYTDGGYIAGLCPFHDDNSPSLLVFEDGWFQCMACDARGTWEKLYNKLNGSPIKYVPREHAEWERPALPKDPELLEALALECHYGLLERDHLAWYWRLRGVEDLIEPCLLGWYNGWYTMPVYDHNQEFQRLILRAGSHIQRASGARYHNSIGGPVMYVPDWHRFLTNDRVAIVYGMIDALAVVQAGFAACTVTSGKAQFKAEWIREARGDHGMPQIMIIPDNYEEKDALDLAHDLQPYARIVQLPYVEDGTEDPADYLLQNKRDRLVKELAGVL